MAKSTSASEIAKKFNIAKKLAMKVIEKSTREALITVFSNVVLSTPVETGRLRANWQSQNQAMPIDTLEDTDLSGSQAIGQLTKEFSQYKINSTAYFINNLPYAAGIEYHGRSKQAPGGMLTPQIANFSKLLVTALKINARREGGKNV